MEPVTLTAKTEDKPASTAYIYRTHKQHLADSAECWPNTISKVLPYHLGKYSASHVNAAGFILDKAVDESNSVSKSTTDI